MRFVLFILAGGLGTPTAMFLIARHLVERHADASAAAIREQYGEPLPTQTRTAPVQDRPAAGRPKELTR